MADVPAINSSANGVRGSAQQEYSPISRKVLFSSIYGIAPYVNPYYQAFVLNARKDFCPTNTIIDKMNALNDPRRAIWFTEYPAGSLYRHCLMVNLVQAVTANFLTLADNIRIDPAVSGHCDGLC